MLIKKPDDIPGNEITPKGTYVNRRLFIRTAVVAGSVAATAGAYRYFNRSGRSDAPPRERLANIVKPGVDPNPAGGQGAANAAGTTGTPSYPAHIRKAFDTDEARTPIGDITHYNNFYEFSTGKEDVAAEAANFVTRPWTVEVTGLCAKPKTFDLAELLSWPQEERVYRMRCVEAWSMVIPWVGFPLSTLLNQVEPRSDAKYVRFETLFDPKRMPNQNADVLDWPYVEGLRMDEAMHPLTILATGIYGEAMPPQNGAPVRLVVPWKYGFKGIKSIVKVQLVADQPVSTWTKANASEYGFYSNVNPDVTHPRWSQASERRIGEYTRRPTLMFNGYGEQVAQLYAGMDLVKNY